MARRNTYREDEVLETPFDYRHLLRAFVYIKKYLGMMIFALILSAIGGITGPQRSGYTFLGWATSEVGNVVYNAADIASVANGTTLYAVWQEQLAQ